MTAGTSFNAADVVVPVYNAPEDLRACVASVLADLRPDVRLVLIDDASPDPAIAAYFAELARLVHPQLVLLRNEHNLGFTGTANRGMQLSGANVVLLNSDTIVTRGWLDALLHCAATDPTIGTITPFSNNAEICSFPRFCEDNPWPLERDAEPERAAIAAAAIAARSGSASCAGAHGLSSQKRGKEQISALFENGVIVPIVGSVAAQCSSASSQPRVTIVSELSSTTLAPDSCMPRLAVPVKPRLRSLRSSTSCGWESRASSAK